MKKVFFLDIDDCLIETSRLGEAELNSLQNSLQEQEIPRAEEITLEFSLNFHRLYDSHQGKQLSKPDLEKLDGYFTRLKVLEKEIIAKYGQIKKWSREVFLFISAEKFEVSLNSEQINYATTNLWKAITDHNPFYEDSLPFLNKIIADRINFYLISASDCRLVYDEKKEIFTYDPSRSKSLKLKRLDKFLKLGIPQNNIFIADPYDKPDPWVFRRAFAKAEADCGQGFAGIMVGDSISNDLVPAWSVGIKKLILINRHNRPVRNESGLPVKTIGNFSEIGI